MPPGWKPGAASRASRGDRPGRIGGALARTCPPRADKAAERSVLRRPRIQKQGSLQWRGHYSLDRPSRLHSRAAKPADSAFVRELTRLRDGASRSPGSSNLHRGPSSNRPNTIASNQPCRVPRGRSSCERWSSIDDTTACCSSEPGGAQEAQQPTNPPVAPCAHAWNPPARCIMPLHPYRLVMITF